MEVENLIVGTHNDCVMGKLGPDFLDVLDEELGVAVGHVDADELDFRQSLHNTVKQCKIGIADAAKDEMIKKI